MSSIILDSASLERALALRDLSDGSRGPHAMQLVLHDVSRALVSAWKCDVREHREDPVVRVEDNYDSLRYPKDGAARDARYTRYVSETLVLRTQTSVMIPPLLRELATSPPRDLLLVCPGLVYRRDAIDRLHTGEPHQVDLWRVSSERRLTSEDLREMIALVVRAALPGRAHRAVPALHPYTEEGLQIDVEADGDWVEIGECGLAGRAVLTDSGHDTTRVSGLAMGLGLDRLLMLRKGIDDIRLLRSDDPRVVAQMTSLEPYRSVSRQPAARRDLSIVARAEVGAEELGDRVREALRDRASLVEAIEVISETPYIDLPAIARERLGIAVGQKNVLVRVVLRDLSRSLAHEEANRLRDEIYAAVHEGTVHAWASKERA